MLLEMVGEASLSGFRTGDVSILGNGDRMRWLGG